eukprot:TRINITY_DN56550_c0_g1_i1.p1 TRINITY_DN56550_c0_g1~~TRINITY_DN56550_c0_g1_i1.p1  ORF type:complete len:249 (-),score=25.85 TRINITY_DN56550_c0_g1_i1:419-1165(-)
MSVNSSDSNGRHSLTASEIVFRLSHPQRRQAVDMCPHSIAALPFLTSHLCHQDRINKEVCAGISQRPDVIPEGVPKPLPTRQLVSKSDGIPLLSEPRKGIGCRHGDNNNSSRIATALGPVSWKASGSLRTSASLASGRSKRDRVLSHGSTAFRDGSAAEAEVHRGAPAFQLKAVQQRGERTILRLARTSDDEVEAARQCGHGTIVALAEGMRAGRTGNSRVIGGFSRSEPRLKGSESDAGLRKRREPR